MEESVNCFPLCKILDANEDYSVDAKGYVFDHVLIVNLVSEAKNKLENQVPILPNSVKPSLSNFTLEQSYSFFEFIQWFSNIPIHKESL